jgi:hypothetical protein
MTRRGHTRPLLAIVDAQSDYAAMDPDEDRRAVLMPRRPAEHRPGKKDGLYWDATG